MRPILATLLTVLTLWAGVNTYRLVTNTGPNGKSAPVSTKCWEDEPCWDCYTMGNHRCGPE